MNDYMDLMRRNFESQFGAVDILESTTRNKQSQNADTADTAASDSEGSQYSDFEGLSGDDLEEEEAPLVVKHTEKLEPISIDPMRSRKEKKLFMSSFAPKDDQPNQDAKNKPPTREDNEDLANDVALQRLIDESHILAEASRKGHFSGSTISSSSEFNFTPTGKYRLKALDARLDKLGVKKDTEKMPMHVRKGMTAKAGFRQTKMVQEAKEAGIVLARPGHKPKAPVKKRDRGLQIASVGRSTKHGLIISKSEIAKYTSGRGGNGKGKGKRRK